MKQAGYHIAKLSTWARLGLGTRLLLSARPGRPRQTPHPHFHWVCSTWATPWARPCLPAARFQQRHGEGRAVQIPSLSQKPPPAPCLSPSQPGASSSTYTFRSGCCITYMSPGLRTARPCSPARTAQPVLWLPHGSCYPNNNTQWPGTSMEWGRGEWIAVPRALYPLRPRKQRLDPALATGETGPERLRTERRSHSTSKVKLLKKPLPPLILGNKPAFSSTVQM